MSVRVGEVHMDDGAGKCKVCGTDWPSECRLEKNAVWFAEADLS
jgi:hypothetical protein